ncbi:phosphate/phosphite/phosphonate ABC transporter substrate-binding protein [Fluviispira multicolorata]|uniref:PhnD/SsuA/transferrin family substrate-binding protein n=1 Tax=Fluviispira multicolorata TaxID=2654512 RepID=A0A833JDM6_9BACT|nr:PhnD/SsuA/transferrin family substrate-binding protein [Fluviispira multicolorata]KAB8031970.1 PhnD/SsuA/transferrin family substrate-binding protein [Fluviispira multicolorata]
MKFNSLKAKTIFHLYLIISIVLLTSCTQMCFNSPELGSKALPVEFYLESSEFLHVDETAVTNLENCIENKTGYRIHFNYATDDKAVISALSRGNAQFALMSALSYVGASAKTSLRSILVLLNKGSPSTRSIIIGKTSVWKSYLNKSGLSLNIFTFQNENTVLFFNNSTIAYTTPESDVGFLVPRMYFLQRNIFPNSAIFVGDYDSVLQSIEEELATAGVISENFLEKKFPNSIPIKIGSQIGHFTILGVSQSIPMKVIVENPKIPIEISKSLIDGLEFCVQEKNTDFKKIFDADGIQKSSEKSFSFTKELYNFQQENIRILTPRNSK